jgi:hypothetical protein
MAPEVVAHKQRRKNISALVDKSMSRLLRNKFHQRMGGVMPKLDRIFDERFNRAPPVAVQLYNRDETYGQLKSVDIVRDIKRETEEFKLVLHSIKRFNTAETTLAQSPSRRTAVRSRRTLRLNASTG